MKPQTLRIKTTAFVVEMYQAVKPDCTFFVQRFNYTLKINAVAQAASGLWLGSTPARQGLGQAPQRKARGSGRD
jgi:hypothetical protein